MVPGSYNKKGFSITGRTVSTSPPILPNLCVCTHTLTQTQHTTVVFTPFLHIHGDRKFWFA